MREETAKIETALGTLERLVSDMNAAGTKNTLHGKIYRDEPMSRHTSWRAGGSTDRYFEPADIDDLCLYLSDRPDDEPILFVGLGSNLLVRDGGFRGSVIATGSVLNGLSLAEEKTIHAEAGVPCAKVARFAAKQGLTGAEFLAGIPGTMGGALAMNAGAFGGETWNIVASVELLDRQGHRKTCRREEFKTAYRHVELAKNHWFLSAKLVLEPDSDGQSSRKIQELLGKRAATQPTGQFSCGSVFRNPPGDHAARLIEDCDLKGFHIGGAYVSDKHANFIINDANASAADIEQLIRHIQQVVRDKHGVELIPEVRIVGEEMNGSSYCGE